MTGRRAYEMYTRVFGAMYDHQRKATQFGNAALIAWDDLSWQEQGAWRVMARQIDKHAARSSAARKVAA